MSGLFWVYLFVLVDVLGFSLILPLMPYYGKEFEASPTTIGRILFSFVYFNFDLVLPHNFKDFGADFCFVLFYFFSKVW
jgi:hypothetical protein